MAARPKTGLVAYSIWLSPTHLERAKALVEPMNEGRIVEGERLLTHADVLRKALGLGLQRLEDDHPRHADPRQ